MKTLKPSVLLIFCLIGFPQITQTIYSPTLPAIAHALATSNQLVQWTLSVYFVGFALGVFYWGRLSDRIGRRPAMLLGVMVYGMGSACCMISPSISILLLASLIQAFGASSGSVVTQTMMREAFADQERLKLFSAIGIALSLFPALGPFLGGYINEWFGWRANFGFLVLMTILLLIYAFKALPETKPKITANKKYGLKEVAILLFKDKRVLGCLWLIAAINGILFSYYAEAPFIFMKIIGITSAQYGWLGLFIAAASLGGSLLSHRLSHILKSDQIMQLGCIVTISSAILLLLITCFADITQQSKFVAVFLLMLPMAGIVFGSFGLILPSTLSTALINFKPMLGVAGALFGLGYYLLIAFFTWLMGLIHTGTLLPMPIYFFVLSVSLLFVFNKSVKLK